MLPNSLTRKGMGASWIIKVETFSSCKRARLVIRGIYGFFLVTMLLNKMVTNMYIGMCADLEVIGPYFGVFGFVHESKVRPNAQA